jgi:beta-galactosidase GanA
MSVLQVEQVLIQSRIPFHLIFDEPLPDLSRLKVLLMPDCECLSDEQLSKIRKFVENGGGIVVTDQTGLFDEWYRPRVEPGLKGLVEGQQRGKAYQETVENAPPLTGLPQRKEAVKELAGALTV